MELMGQLMYLKEYICGLLTIGLRSNYQKFIDYCFANNLPELPKMKFIDLEFDLTVAMRDVPTVCPYVSYMKYKDLDFVKLPPLAEQAKNLAKSAWVFLSSGFELAPDDEQERRYDICKSCDYLTQGRCSKCGCFMKYKSKIKVVTCPDGRW
jgi:hypothetical protein